MPMNDLPRGLADLLDAQHREHALLLADHEDQLVCALRRCLAGEPVSSSSLNGVLDHARCALVWGGRPWKFTPRYQWPAVCLLAQQWELGEPQVYGVEVFRHIKSGHRCLSDLFKGSEAWHGKEKAGIEVDRPLYVPLGVSGRGKGGVVRLADPPEE